MQPTLFKFVRHLLKIWVWNHLEYNVKLKLYQLRASDSEPRHIRSIFLIILWGFLASIFFEVVRIEISVGYHEHT